MHSIFLAVSLLSTNVFLTKFYLPNTNISVFEHGLLMHPYVEEPVILKVDVIDYPEKGNISNFQVSWSNIVCTSRIKPTVTESNGFWIIKIKAEEKK